MKKVTVVSFSAFAFAALASSCGGGDSEELAETTEDAVSGTLIERSLAVTDPEILARFSFTRTMDAIRSTALASTESLAAGESRLAIYQRWMRSFGTGPDGCDRPELDPNGYGFVCPRTPEAKLATINPFAGGASVTFVPVGLFNRFDLMSEDGATCGEHRIVYAMQLGGGAPFGGRALIIFEAALPNPNPQLGVDGCLPVATFWQQLSNDENVSSRATKLENFYYRGTAIAGFAAVVRAGNYGLTGGGTGPVLSGRTGQIRTNFFVDNVEWQLREFKLRKRCPTASSCQLLFDHVTVKTNPAEELFAGTHARSGAFRTEFAAQVEALAAASLTGISMTIGNSFNELESVSQRRDVVYRSEADSDMRNAIGAELTRLGSRLSVNNVLDRATTQTCAGCHQLSAGQALGGGLSWPRTLGFVHIDEGRRLSAALTGVFLPQRLRVLEDFINAREFVARPVEAAN